ncbi:MAG: phosphate acyltransferase PlsX [Pseudomonadota bacterium]
MTVPSSTPVTLAVDAMGADGGISVIADGLAIARSKGLDAHVKLYGREGEIKTALASRDIKGAPPTIHHMPDVISMEDKPTAALRRGRGSSMWAAIADVKERSADAVISSGNTGALMAMSVLQLRMIEGIDRPAITSIWPTKTGRTAVLDVGANVEATAKQLVQFAIMGEAYFRALTGKQKPQVGILNVGAEELKGHDLIRKAADTLREADPEMDFVGFIEGDDLTSGVVDVAVTDGFTGNIALKTAEGTARMIGAWVKEALTGSLLSKAGALLMMPALKSLKEKMNPSHVNGAPLLGLNGLVIKSHGGADAEGIAAALLVAQNLAQHPFQEEISRTVAKVEAYAASHGSHIGEQGEDEAKESDIDKTTSAKIEAAAE